MNIVVYTKSGCPNCVTAKKLLDSKGIGFEERSMEDGHTAYLFMNTYPHAKQMPQIFMNDQRVGGLAGLQAALKQVGL
jgi:glutaredoxin 3